MHTELKLGNDTAAAIVAGVAAKCPSLSNLYIGGDTLTRWVQ